MKLNELLKKITPLPWKHRGILMCDPEMNTANSIYRNHAANVLPDLVEAARLLSRNCDTEDVNGAILQKFEDALVRAEEVKVKVDE